jgi:uncharacterized SAM-binding protein YcdF (DUF218 family)
VLRRSFTVVATFVAALLLVVALVGVFYFTNYPDDAVRKADAIVVLGGEHDGREQYGLKLLREGVAPVLLMSNPYPASDSTMQRMCATRVQNAEVLCLRPEPLTTRGEALLTRQLAQARNWRTIVIVSWRFHLPRAKMIFEKCFSDEPGALIMRAVPRQYNYSLAFWEFTYLYQSAGVTKTLLQSSCGPQ